MEIIVSFYPHFIKKYGNIIFHKWRYRNDYRLCQDQRIRRPAAHQHQRKLITHASQDGANHLIDTVQHLPPDRDKVARDGHLRLGTGS